LEPLKRDPSLGEPLDPSRPEIGAQVVYAALREDARHLEDALLRRLEIGYTSAGKGPATEKASRLMAGALGWDEPTRLRELERYFQKREPRGNA
jgi:glycerol-3-phosphate dehydrogenase